MKKMPKLLLLLVPFLLVSCGPTSNPTSEPTAPSEEPTTEPTSSTDDEFKKLVINTIGSKTKLSNHIKTFADTSIVSLNTSSSKENAYSSESTTTNIMFRSKEIYANSVIEESTSTTANTTSETTYIGIVDDVYYNANIGESVFSNVRRYKITDDRKLYEIDKITLAEAEEQLLGSKDSYDMSMITEYSFWSDILSANARQRTFEYTIFDDYVRVVVEAYTEGYTNTDYQFIVSFDYDLKLISGVLNTTKYSSDDWDKTNHIPLEDALFTSKSKVSLDGVEYGEPLETTNKTMIDLSSYFIETLNSSLITINNSATNPVTGMPVYSEANTVYPKQPIDCPVDLIKENKAFAPATALDVNSLYITGVSKEGFLTADEFGWNVTGNIDDTAKVYIGNAFNPVLAEIEVTIVKNPIKNKTVIGSNVFFVTDSETGNYTYNAGGVRPTLICKEKNTIILAVATHNEGPFDEITVGFHLTNTIISCEVLADQEQYYEQYSYAAVYFSLTVESAGETVLAITDKTTGEGFFEITVKTEL